MSGWYGKGEGHKKEERKKKNVKSVRFSPLLVRPPHESRFLLSISQRTFFRRTITHDNHDTHYETFLVRRLTNFLSKLKIINIVLNFRFYLNEFFDLFLIDFFWGFSHWFRSVLLQDKNFDYWHAYRRINLSILLYLNHSDIFKKNMQCTTVQWRVII